MSVKIFEMAGVVGYENVQKDSNIESDSEAHNSTPDKEPVEEETVTCDPEVGVEAFHVSLAWLITLYYLFQI